MLIFLDDKKGIAINGGGNAEIKNLLRMILKMIKRSDIGKKINLMLKL